MTTNSSQSSHAAKQMTLSSAKRERRLQRLPGSATSGGPEYEWKLAGLLALRAYQKGLRFEVFSNVEVVRPFDDIVLRLLGSSPTTYCVQLKHSKIGVARKSLGQMTFIGTSGDFSLAKYFACYEELRLLSDAPRDSLSRDQQLLLETPFDRMRFVLFTTKSVAPGDDRFVTEGDSFTSERDFPFHELFFTTEEGAENSVNFDSTYSKIWTFLDDDAERKPIYQREFLGKLKVFHKQAYSNEMDDIIREDMIRVFGRIAAMFQSPFMEFLKEWSERDDYDFCLSNETLLDFFGQQLRQTALRAICKDLEFKTESLEALRFALRQPMREQQRRDANWDHVIVSGVSEPGLRAAKVIQAVRAEFGEDAWLYVDSSILNGFHFDILTVAARTVCVLITDVEPRDLAAIRELVAAVGCEVRVVALQSATKGTKIDQGDPNTSIEDVWFLSDLNDESQREMLQRLVVFQGKEMLLKDLEATWPTMRQDVGVELLASKREWIIGNPLEDCEDALLPRHLSHFNMVSARALTEKEVAMKGGRLALGGFPQFLLESACRRLGFLDSEGEDEEEVSRIVRNNSRWTVINYDHEPSPKVNEKFLGSLAKEKGVSSIHWIEYIGGGSWEDVCIVWRGSFGETVTMQAFVETITDHCCTEQPLCNHPSTKSLKTLKQSLLVGQAGLGKTTTLLRLAVEFKEENPARWVVVLKILQLRDLLRLWKDVTDVRVDHVVELLSRAAGTRNATTARRCLEAALRRSGAVTVLIDGVDEIAPAFKELTMSLLHVLLTQTAVECVWVSSRPEVEASLRRVLRTPPFTLQPLTKQEQLAFLGSYFASTSGHGTSEEENTSRAWEQAELAMQLMVKMDDLLGTPLHLQMAAEVFSRMNLDHELPKNLSSLNLYREFISKKQNEYERKYSLTIDNIPLDNFEEKHQKCAMVFLFADDSSANDLLPFQEYKEYVLNNDSLVRAKEKFGIVWLDAARSLHFVHQTFAEFFAAKWFLANTRHHKGARHWLLRMNNPWREKTKIQLFLEDMLEEGWPLHAAAWRRDMRQVERLIGAGWGRQRWREEDAMLQWTFGQYLLWAYEDSIYLYPEEEEFESPWMIVAVRAAAKSGCPKVIEEVLRSASLPDTSLQMALRDAVGGEDVGHMEVARILLEYGVMDDTHKRERGKTALHLAAKNGNTTMMDLFMKHCDINAQDYLGHTPLHFAMFERSNFKRANFERSNFERLKHQHEAVQRLLREESVDVNVVDYAGNTPLSMAFWADCESCVETLLQRGAQLQPGEDGDEELLFLAASKKHLNVVKTLLKRGVEVNARANHGWTALHSAALCGQLEVVETLVAEGADIYIRNSNGDTALDVAIHERHEETAKHLMEHLIFKAFCEAPRSEELNACVLKAAAKMGCEEEVLEMLERASFSRKALSDALRAAVTGESRAHANITRVLLKQGATEDKTEKRSILHLAAEGGNASIVDLLLKSFPESINARTTIGQTPLHLAIGNKCKTHRHEAAQRLLEEQTVDIEALDQLGNPALPYAAGAACVQCTETLLRRGADVNRGDRLPLMAAAISSCDVLRILLDHKARVNASSGSGATALHYAAIHERNDSLQMLLEAGADLRLKNGTGDTAMVLALQYNLKHVATFLMERSSKSIIEEHFIEAAKNKNVAVLEFLLEGGANPRAEDAEQNTALHRAASEGHANIVQILLAGGARVDATNRKKETALHLACWQDRQDVMELLLLHGAHVNALNEDGNTPLHLAAHAGNRKAVEMLLTKEADKGIKNKKDMNALQLALRTFHWHCAKVLMGR